MIKRIAAAVVALAFVGFIGYRASVNYKAKRAAANRPVAEKIVPVRTASPQSQTFVDTIKAAGNVQANAEVALFSKVPGKIIQNNVQMGSAVTPGLTVTLVNRDEVGYQFKTYEVKSDVKGVVSRILQNPGAMVGPATPLMTLVDIDLVKAVAAVDELKIRFVRMGQPVKVRFQAYPGEVFNARVTNISPVANPVSRTIEVEVTIPNASHRVKPGMYAEAEFEQGQHSGRVLPIVAVVDRAGRKYVFTVAGDRAVLKEVATGAVAGDMIEITAGLDGTETVVTTGADRLEDKDRVTVVKS
ncbi:MAG TPA: efflux RND transporter periplasmic adaptor subunit [Candidatus Bathyarchaeia archaeon]|nr:efflux RND transporter periplasmic adaptor subunit [Candidatus Bathyarchaeia archaeon]